MIIAVFALLFSVNFSVYFLVLHRRLKEALKSDELRFFLGVVAAATVVITLDLLPMYQNALESLRYAFSGGLHHLHHRLCHGGLCPVAPAVPAGAGPAHVLRRPAPLHRRRRQCSRY